jgi:2-keto-3-deoxy-6-phosphogluconate aldolase
MTATSGVSPVLAAVTACRVIPVLARMAQQPGLLAGAGTVVRPDQVDRVHATGARFVVCPASTRTSSGDAATWT